MLYIEREIHFASGLLMMSLFILTSYGLNTEVTISGEVTHAAIVFAAALELDAKARREEDTGPPKKKTRLYFTDSQKRALFAIFKETKKPSKEMQNALAEELGLERDTVANFFMNARRRHPEL